MLVYGDRSEHVDPRAYGEALHARCDGIAAWPAGFAKTAAISEALIAAGKLVQGLADHAFEADGCERWDVQQKLAIRAAAQIAGRLGVAWKGYDDPTQAQPFASLLQLLIEEDLPEQITPREPEGYAFYAVYPELYVHAGADARTPPRPRVVGVRSIGASLGVAACPCCEAVTLRPVGDPYARELRLGASMREALLAPAPDGYLVVDEGPGASGSSFGAIGDLLEDAGVAPETITYMPSHLGDLGPQASERHRARWRTARKLHASFEDAILPRLPGWTEPLIGPLAEPLRDLSGGLWREAGVDAPAWPEQERRKYLATTREGRFLLKFAGLGDIAPRKLARARALHAAGLTPEPMGVAHGFLVERWVEDAPHPPGAPSEEALGRYVGFRVRDLQPPRGAASDALLLSMMRRNLELAGLPELAARAVALPAGERGPPCAIDGRLHAWEWRVATDGRPIKLDALDHCEAHDLVGAQDVAWDLAGAAVEHDLAPEAAERLRRIVAAEAGRAIDPRRVDFQTLAYLAFQIGWWTFAAQGCEGAQAQARADGYTRRATDWRPLA